MFGLMLRMPAPPWLRMPGVADFEEMSVDRAVSMARLCLVAAALIATWLDPAEPARYTAIVIGVLFAYALFALAVLAFPRISQDDARLPWVQAVDLAVATVLTLFTSGPASPFFLLLVFALVTAARRWEFHGTRAMVPAAIGLLALEAVLMSSSSDATWTVVEGTFDLHRLIVRSSFLVVLGLLIHTLARRERRRRSEAANLAWVVGKAGVRSGVKGTTEAVLSEVLRFFDARRALLVVRDTSTDAAYLWDSHPAHRECQATFAPIALERESGEPELFEAPGEAWHATSRSGSSGGSFDFLALDVNGRPLPQREFALPASFLARYPCRSILAVTMTLGDEWIGRTYVLDPMVAGDRPQVIRFAQRLGHEVGLAIYNVFMLQRMRARAGARERGRLARELHDGVMQSLIASQGQLDLLRQRTAIEAPHLADHVAQVEELLRKQVLELRDLTRRLRSD
jgi:signal transduction histidine kinase